MRVPVTRLVAVRVTVVMAMRVTVVMAVPMVMIVPCTDTCVAAIPARVTRAMRIS